MLKTTSLAVICCLVLFGCKKDDTVATNNSNTSNEDTTYLMAGVGDISLGGATENKTMMIALSPVGSQQGRITLSVEGLPEHVSASFDPGSGNVPFTSTLSIKNNYAKAGSYDMVVKGTSEAGKTKSLKFKLTTPSASCVEFLAKNTNKYIMKTEAGKTVDSFFIKDFDNNRLWFEYSFLDDPEPPNSYHVILRSKVYINADCNTSEITIPEQKVLGQTDTYIYKDYKVSGKGTYNRSNKTIEMNLTVVKIENNVTKKYTLKTTIR